MSSRIKGATGLWAGFLTGVVLAIAGYAIYGRHLLDRAVPFEGDVRSHIFKIEHVYQHITSWNWSWYSFDWCCGFPILQNYPPGFYLVGGFLPTITHSSIISYKVLMLATFVILGLSAFYFARGVLKLSPLTSSILSIVYPSSAPILLNFSHGTGPDLIAWDFLGRPDLLPKPCNGGRKNPYLGVGWSFICPNTILSSLPRIVSRNCDVP